MRTVRYNHLKLREAMGEVQEPQVPGGSLRAEPSSRQPKKERLLMNEAMVEAINEREPAFLARDGKGKGYVCPQCGS